MRKRSNSTKPCQKQQIAPPLDHCVTPMYFPVLKRTDLICQIITLVLCKNFYCGVNFKKRSSLVMFSVRCTLPLYVAVLQI